MKRVSYPNQRHSQGATRYRGGRKKNKSFAIILMACVPALIAVFVVATLITGNGDSGSGALAKETKTETKGADQETAAAAASLYEIPFRAAGSAKVPLAAGTIGASRATAYVEQPKDKLEFRLDARRLLFGNPGDTLQVKVAAVPAGVSLKKSKVEYASSDENVAVIDKDGMVTAKNYGKCTISARIGNLKTETAVQVANKWVAITFDDGPCADTLRLLDAMKTHSVNSTFFVVGEMVAEGEKYLQAAYNDGNEIANHTYTHSGSAGVILPELEKTDAIIKKVTGKPAALMRPPGGAINDNTKKCGKPIIMWSVDPQDWLHRDADYVSSHVLNQTVSGSIVLLHDIHRTSVDAAIRIFDSLDKDGYAFVTVSQILNDPQPGEVYYEGSSPDVRTMKIPY